MMKQEFEALAGYEVSFQDYNEIIEPMYMATNLSKQDFVKCIDRKRFALPTKKEIVRAMKKEATHLYEICGRYTDFESKDRLEATAKAYAKRFHGIDWAADVTAWVYFIDGYEIEYLKCGCTYPKELVIGRGGRELERITLVA